MKSANYYLDFHTNFFKTTEILQMLTSKKILVIAQNFLIKYKNKPMSIAKFFSIDLQRYSSECSIFEIEIVQKIAQKMDSIFENRVGSLEDISKIFLPDSFDVVILLDSLETSKNPMNVVSDLKKIVKENGMIFLYHRTPKSNLYDYDNDIWRFEEEDIRNMFPEDQIFFADSRECLLSIINLKTKKIPKFDLKIWNFRTKSRINVEKFCDVGFFKLTELDSIGIRESTDKSSIIHDYLSKYEFFLKQLRNEKFTLIELGIFGGSSLKMWKKYFPRAQIVGVDINKFCRKFEENRIKIEILDLSVDSNLELLTKLNPLIVIDDASHTWKDQIKAMSIIYPSLPTGGIYIIEDLETSFKFAVKNLLGHDVYFNFDIDAVTFIELINRVVISKLSLDKIFTNIPIENLQLDGINLTDTVNKIGMSTDLVALMNGSAIFIKR